MKFDLDRSFEIWERTPAVLRALLSGIHNDWVFNNEGPETFSPFDVMGHLIHGEYTDWPVRVKLILDKGVEATFDPYDRFAMYRESADKTITDLLDEFERIRNKNMEWLRSLLLTANELDRKGIHPTFGEVTLRELLATWVVHDLTHLAQINRVMAKQYKSEIGPWFEYFRILQF